MFFRSNARPFSRIALACLVVLLGAAAPAFGQKTTTVILARHAEKEAQPAADPPLTAAGTERAQELARIMESAGVTAVYVTQFARTRLTAEPTAKKVGVPVDVVAASGDMKDYAAEVAKVIREKHAGGTVLVVSHSNTVPLIVEALGGTTVRPIGEDDYDNLIIVTLHPDGKATVIPAKFGVRSAGKM
jgi:broad specificity phosphatase PhoE